MQLRNRILTLLTPLQKWLQRQGYVESHFTVSDIEYIISIIKAGDVLLSYESGRLTSPFIKGEWKHAAIVDHNLHVVEAVGDYYIPIKGADPETFKEKIERIFFNKPNLSKNRNIGGVRKVRLDEFLWKKNHVAVVRHEDRDIAFKASFASQKYIGRGYDYSFTENDDHEFSIKENEENERFYCSELVYVCYSEFDKEVFFFHGIKQDILPNDFLSDVKFQLIYNSRDQSYDK